MTPMQPRFGPMSDPLRDQTEEEIAQIYQMMMGHLADSVRYGRLPQSNNIEDRRTARPQDTVRDMIMAAQPPPQRGPRPRWMDTYTPTEQELRITNNSMDPDELHGFFKAFPAYTRALMILEGRNPSETPDVFATTPGEWEAINRNRSTLIEEKPDEGDEGVEFEDRWQGEKDRGYP